MRLTLALFLASSPAWSQPSQFTYGELTTLESLDPYTPHNEAAKRLADLLFDNLIDINENNEYEPNLAKAWEISPDRTSVTISLVQTAYWHDHDPARQSHSLGCEDLARTVAALQNPESQIPNKQNFLTISSILELQPHKCQVKFTRSLSDPLKPMVFKVLPAHLTPIPLTRSEAFARKPIGSGPYKIIERDQDGTVKLLRNPYYHKRLPNIERIIMRPFNSRAAMAKSLVNGDVDLLTDISPREISHLLYKPAIRVIPYDVLSFSFIGINLRLARLRDLKIRQALAHAIARKKILTSFFKGKGRLVSGPFHPSSWSYNSHAKIYHYSPEKSEQLLREAGLYKKNGLWIQKNGLPFRLRLAIPFHEEGISRQKLANDLKQNLDEIGIKLEISYLDWPDWRERVIQKHDFDLTYASWSYDRAQNITTLFQARDAIPGGNNFVGYKNAKVDALLNEANGTNAFQIKQLAFRKIHQQLAKDLPYIFLWTMNRHAGHRSTLKNVHIGSNAFFDKIALWQVANRGVADGEQ